MTLEGDVIGTVRLFCNKLFALRGFRADEEIPREALVLHSRIALKDITSFSHVPKDEFGLDNCGEIVCSKDGGGGNVCIVTPEIPMLVAAVSQLLATKRKTDESCDEELVRLSTQDEEDGAQPEAFHL